MSNIVMKKVQAQHVVNKDVKVVAQAPKVKTEKAYDYKELDQFEAGQNKVYFYAAIIDA
jgi:hypothetical protein